MNTSPYSLDLSNPPDTVCVNLYVTQRCNFKCAHCLCEAGPRKPKEYVSREVVHKVVKFLKSIHALWDNTEYVAPNISINLIGGEPTLDMDAFARTCKNVSDAIAYDPSRYGISLEMTTNGWWLNKLSTVADMQRAIRWLPDMTVRISDDDYHNEFRTKGTKAYQALFQKEPFKGTWGTKPTNHLLTYLLDMKQDSDPDNNDDDRLSYELCRRIEENQGGGEGAVYIDNTREYGDKKISPVGRAAKNGIGYQFGHCSEGEVNFDVFPDGSIKGFCCLGSRVSGGATLDNPYDALAKRQEFIRRVNVALKKEYGWPRNGCDCEQCPTFAKDFDKENKFNIKSSNNENT